MPRIVHVDRRSVAWLTLLLGLSITLLLTVLGATYYRIESGNNLALLLASKDRALELAALSLTESMTGVISDLRYLSQHNELEAFLESGTAVAASGLEREYAAFLGQKRVYDQIRFIGLDGWERIRVNRARDGVRITPAEQLQHKASRYYFQAMLKLRPDEIYVSPMDLNIEHGRIETPPKPVVRVALGVSDQQGQRQGYVILNVLAAHMLQRLRSITGGRQAVWMLDARGDWLMAPTDEEAWSGQLPERRLRAFSKRNPAAWAEISKHERGLHVGRDMHFQYLRVYPLRPTRLSGEGIRLAEVTDVDRYYWILVAATPHDVMQAANAHVMRTTLTAGTILSLLAFALSAALAHALVRGRALSAALGNAVDNVPMLISYVDAGQRYRFNNLAYLRMFGLSPHELYGKHVREVLGEQAYEQILPHIKQVLAGQRVDFEQRLDYSDAGPREVAVAYLPDLTAGGQVRGFYAVVSDITPLKESQRRERQHLLEVAHVSRLASVGELATEIAHQINQPLSAIAMFNGAVLRNLESGGDRQKARDWLGMIDAQVKRASDIVARMRRFVQKGDNQLIELDLNILANDVATLLEFEVKAKQVALTLELGDNLPAVRADRILMEQVIYHLTRNAIEAAAGSDQGGRVTLCTRADANRVRVEVTDSGPGVDEAMGERIFDPFSSHKPDGVGIGLAISRTILAAIGGELGYSNRPEGGAMFFFTVPGARHDPR